MMSFPSCSVGDSAMMFGGFGTGGSGGKKTRGVTFRLPLDWLGACTGAGGGAAAAFSAFALFVSRSVPPASAQATVTSTQAMIRCLLIVASSIKSVWSSAPRERGTLTKLGDWTETE